jgi:cardiolipin synthase
MNYLTIPNGLTVLRGLGIPVFMYLALSLHADGWAILTLIVAGATDYFDGKLARAWNQTSKFGEIFDPAIDRLYINATLIVLYLRDAIPLWLIAILFSRDLILAVFALALQLKKQPQLKVSYLGKAATFNLLYAFPLLLLALVDSWYGTLAFIAGWSFTIWGLGLYIGTGIGYIRDAVTTIARINRHTA